MTTPELSHVVTLAEAGAGKTVTLTADAAVRAAIAKRLDLVQLDRFEARVEVRAVAGGIGLRGEVQARLVQSCAATDLPVPATIAEPFDLKFLRDLQPDEDGEIEVELDAEDIDILPLEHDRVDLGEVAVQTLSLALDPFPRHPDADRILAEKGVLSEEQAGPFAALAALRGKPKA